MKLKNLKNSLFLRISALLFIFTASLFGAERNALDLYNKALAAEAEENWYVAEQNYIEVVNINPAFSDAWFRLADCSYRLGEYDLGLQYLLEAERYQKNNSKIQNLKGMIFLALGQIDEAKEIFNEILKKYPNDIDAHFGLAEIELYSGKYSGAEEQYIEALKRQNSNRKALLSLALIYAQTDRYSLAEKYLNQAMSYYSGESEVHYIAAIIYLMKGEYKESEKHAKIAVEINENYDKAYSLLSSVLFLQGRYKDVIDLTDFLIGKDRNNASAWYVKGLSLYKLGNNEDAIEMWITGLEIFPQDELMRTQLELLLRNTTPLTDERRRESAVYHLNNAALYETHYDRSGLVYEYQRALLLDPKNKEARLAYANILEMNGMHELYLNQLQFVQDNYELNTTLKDTIEAYDSLLSDTLAKQWNVDPFYLNKIRWNIAIFYTEKTNNIHHADAQRLTALACSDIFSGIAITSVKTQVTPVSSYAEAFRTARTNNFDYFILVKLNEGKEDITLEANMFSGRTGTRTFQKSFYATGNNRYSTVLRRFRNSVLDQLTVKGKILARNGKTVLVDLGKSENILKDSEFRIVKKGCVRTSDAGSGLIYKDEDAVGTLIITKTGEEVSEAVITEKGFYDRINIDDEIVLIKVPETKAEGAIDTVPNADNNGNALTVSSVSGEALVNEIKKAVEHPAILDLLRDVY